MKRKILQLSVAEPWYSMLASGEKKEEYRDIKPYWIKRLCVNDNCNVFKPYTHVLFINGYGAARPHVMFRIKEICIGKPHAEWCPASMQCEDKFIIRLK